MKIKLSGSRRISTVIRLWGRNRVRKQDAMARRSAERVRLNGAEKDLEGLGSHRLPADGKYKWTKGELKSNGVVYGLARPGGGGYDYEVEYRAGRRDIEWFCQIDCNYLSRIERERNLQTKEPAVWAMRELDRARGKNVRDIRAWWRGYIFPNGPNGKFYDDKVLGALLDEAPSIFVGRLLVADMVRHLPQGSREFERGLLNVIKGYLGLKIIRPGVGQLPQTTLSASGAPASKRGIFSSEYYERKDREAEKAAEKSIKPKVM